MIGLACVGLVDHVWQNVLTFLWLVASVADADADPEKKISVRMQIRIRIRMWIHALTELWRSK